MNCPECDKELTSDIELFGNPGVCWNCWWQDADYYKTMQEIWDWALLDLIELSK